MPQPCACPLFQRAANVLGKRWTSLIVHALLQGRSRFAELLNGVDGLSDRMLSERLKELEAEGIVARRVVPDTPVRVEYSLTPKGHDLHRVLVEIHGWAERWPSAAARTAERRTREVADDTAQER